MATLENKPYRAVYPVQNTIEASHHRVCRRRFLQFELIITKDPSHNNFGFVHGEEAAWTCLRAVAKHEMIRCSRHSLAIISRSK